MTGEGQHRQRVVDHQVNPAHHRVRPGEEDHHDDVLGVPDQQPGDEDAEDAAYVCDAPEPALAAAVVAVAAVQVGW